MLREQMIKIFNTCRRGNLAKLMRTYKHIVAEPKDIYTMASLALRYGHADVFVYLEATGARVPCLQKEDALKHIASNGYAKFMKLCVSRGIVMNEDYVKFAIGANANSLDTVKCLIHLSDLTILSRKHINHSVMSGKFEIFKYIAKYLESAGVRINYGNLLGTAVMCDRNDIIQYLVVAKGAIITESMLNHAYSNFVFIPITLTIYLLTGLGGEMSHGFAFPGFNKHLAMYKAVYIRNRDKIRNRAASRIYFWWIQVCHPLSRPSGIRLMLANVAKFETLCANGK